MKTNLLKILIVTICLFFIYNYIVDNNKITQIILNTNYKTILYITLFSSIVLTLYSQIIYLTLVMVCKIKISYKKWFLIYFNSQFLNSIPLFGIFYRAAQLKKFNLNYDKFFGIYLMINWLFLFLSLIFFSLEIFLLFGNIEIININLSLILFFIGVFFLFIPIVSLRIIKYFIHKYFLNSNLLIIKIEKLIDLFLNSLKNKLFLKYFLILFAVIHIIEFLILNFLINTLVNNVTLDNVFIIFMGNVLIDTLNILPQNLVVSEIGMGLLTTKLNYNFELGVLIKIYYRFVVFFASVFIALLYNIYILYNNK